MGRATPPFRADHVGSLLRPRRLLQARDDQAAGRVSEEELRAVEDDAIRDVVAMQRNIGLQSATDGEFRYRGGQAAIDRDIYPDLEQFWSDLGDAYAEQVRRIGELGCTYLQFDDTSLAYLNDPAQRAMVAGRGDDAEHLHLRYIQQINRALAGRPPGMAVTTHLCRGNFRSSWAAEGGYDFVAEAQRNMLTGPPPDA